MGWEPQHLTDTVSFKLYRLFLSISIFLNYILNTSVDFFFPILLVSFIFYGFRIQKNIEALKTQKNQLESGFRTFQITESPDQLSSDNPAFAARVLDESYKKGIYNFREVKANARGN